MRGTLGERGNAGKLVLLREKVGEVEIPPCPPIVPEVGTTGTIFARYYHGPVLPNSLNRTHIVTMSRLIINPDTPASWEIQLNPGPNLIGRSPANDIRIEHNSVADTHCQITISGPFVTVKDLGSATGTLLGGILVSESRLEHGAVLQLGEIVVRFETDTPAAVNPSTLLASPVSCRTHPNALAKYLCPSCGQFFCELCVDRKSVRGRIERFCRTCGAECDTFRANVPDAEPPPPFAGQIKSAFGYPLQGDGLILLGAGAVFFFVLSVVASFAALVGLILSLAAAGYVVCYYQQILTTSATGRDTMPDWPDFTGLGDLISPITQFLGTLLFAFGPAIAINVLTSADQPWKPWVLMAAIGAGCIYFPMGFMAVTMADSLAALNPLVIIPSMLKIPGAYLMAVVILAAVVVNWIGNAFLPQVLPVPILPGVIGEFVGLYLATVEMRILGLLYRSKEEELGWFAN